MKNLFKNLMLVAVAAMAFTACSQDVNEVNKIERVTRYEFTANFADDTRSGFAEKEEGATAYKSEWHEGDEVKVFIDNYGTVTTGIDTEGNFALELTDAPEPFFMTVCAPADSWTGVYGWTVPTEQTPLANSVDPKAHILRSNEGILVANGTPNQKIVMSHYASYGKMTVNGVEFKINKVEVSFNGGQVYTINATNVENNTFWFAISDNNLTVSEFTVTAYGDGESVVTKTVTIPENRELKFNWGRVSTFSVKDLEKVEEVEEVPTADYTATNIVWNNNEERFELTGPNITSFYIKMNAADRPGNNSFAVGEYTGVNSRTTPEKQFSVYQKVGGGYTISWTDTSSASTMSIEVKNGEYLIYINYVALWNQGAFTLVYKGLPAGFVLPGESGGDEPVNPEPSDAPKFVRAAITNDYATQDKEITFYGNGINLYDLSLDFIGTFEYLEDESVILKEGVYDADVNKDSLIDTSYSSYDGGEVWDLTVTVSHVSSGYYIVVENVTSDEAGNNIVITKATYTGEIEGLAKPQVSGGDEPEQPAEPGTESNPYVFTGFQTGYYGYWLDFSGSEDGAWLRLSCQSTNRSNIEGNTKLSAGPWYTSEHSYVVNNVTYVIDNGLNVTSSEATITNNGDGTYTCLFKIVYTGGVTYYTYTGAL